MEHNSTEWLRFSRRERAGILTLLFLSGLFWIAPAYFPRWPAPAPVDFSDFNAYVALLSNPAPEAAVRNTSVAEEALFPFNPNEASEETLLRLGLPSALARRVINYRNKGGRFRKPEDFRKIYGLGQADYERLAPFLQLSGTEKAIEARPATQRVAYREFLFDPNTVGERELADLGLPARVIRTWVNYRTQGGRFRNPDDLGKIYGITQVDLERLRPWVRLEPLADTTQQNRASFLSRKTWDEDAEIDINQADVAAWEQLRGIGPVLANRIVRFRDQLGGFTSVEQVAETYGLPDSTFTGIRSRLRSSPLLRPLAVNRLEEEELSRHPYLNRRQARALVAYRRQHGPFSSPEEVAGVRALPEDLHRRLAPYWSFER